MDMKFDFTPISKMATRYQGGERIVRDEIRVGMTSAVVQIEADAKRLVPVDTRNLYRSLIHEVTQSGNTTTGRAGSNLGYAKIVEDGRTPGRMPPPGVLLDWMRRHGIDAKFEFVVRRAINRRKRPQPYLKPALDKNRPAINREMLKVLERIAAKLAGAG